MGWRYLAGGDSSGETDPTMVFLSLSRIYTCRWLGLRCTEDNSSPAMAARRHDMMVHRPSLATARPSEHRNSIKVTTWTCLVCLGFVRMHWRGCPRARRHGGESVMAMSVIFDAGEVMTLYEVST